MFLLPHIKSFPNEKKIEEKFRGKKIFGIFENTLSKEGIYYFIIDSEGEKCRVAIQRFSKLLVEEEFDNIMDGLKYIQEYHYYEKRRKYGNI